MADGREEREEEKKRREEEERKDRKTARPGRREDYEPNGAGRELRAGRPSVQPVGRPALLLADPLDDRAQ